MTKEAEQSQRRALGKGLSALLPSRAPVRDDSESAHATISTKAKLPQQFEDFQNIRLDLIQPNSEQPRESFDAGKLEELAQSIRANGLIQPITVYRTREGNYKIIAGERRWRAAGLAGLQEIPALVRSVEESELLQLALIENIQREDLNPVEIATAFQSLMDQHGLTHEEIAQRTGKDRSTITNFVRLLRLSGFVLHELATGKISVGHARALLNVTNDDAQVQVCDEIVKKRLSVRETEQLVKSLTIAGERRQPKDFKREIPPMDANIRAALEEMARVLGTRVRMVAKSEKAGRLEVEYYSKEDLDRIYSVIVKQ